MKREENRGVVTFFPKGIQGLNIYGWPGAFEIILCDYSSHMSIWAPPRALDEAWSFYGPRNGFLTFKTNKIYSRNLINQIVDPETNFRWLPMAIYVPVDRSYISAKKDQNYYHPNSNDMFFINFCSRKTTAPIRQLTLF